MGVVALLSPYGTQVINLASTLRIRSLSFVILFRRWSFVRLVIVAVLPVA